MAIIAPSTRGGGIAPAGCDCEGCVGMAAEYGADPALLAFYRAQLLRRGWAGKLTEVERAYVRAHAEWARQAANTGAASLAKHRWRGPKSQRSERVSATPDEMVVVSKASPATAAKRVA
jgi:hypothetical protein